MNVIRNLEALPPDWPRPVATIGNFDGMHLGHQELLRDLVARSREIGTAPAVITFHPHPLQVLAPDNAPRQIQTLEQKLGVMEAMGVRLAVVIPFTRELAQVRAREFAVGVLWERLRLREIYVGPNFAFGHRREGSFNLLKEVGEEKGFFVGKIHQVQFRGSRVSSTGVRQALVSGHVGLARRLLGRPFALRGSVGHGTSTGSGIRVPTANLLTSNELLPRRGVYATFLVWDGARHAGVTNIGFRPTMTAGDTAARLSIETHVLDFDGDLYGRNVDLEFLVRLREEMRFGEVEGLVAQIRRDIIRARRYLAWLDQVEGCTAVLGSSG